MSFPGTRCDAVIVRDPQVVRDQKKVKNPYLSALDIVTEERCQISLLLFLPLFKMLRSTI